MCTRQRNLIIISIFIYLALFLEIVYLSQNLAPKNSSHVPKSPLPIVPLCLLKCKDNHMLQMENEWSSDFVFPLNDLLRSGASSEQMSERVDELCRHNSELAKCLQECPPSVENEILQLGLRPWQNICEKMRDMQTQFGCWKTNIDAILLECSFESQKLRYDIESFTRNVSVQLVETICIDLAHLSDCTVGQYGKHCGHISKMLIGTLFTNSRDAIVKMLRMKWDDEVPSKCGPMTSEQTKLKHSMAFQNGTSAASSQRFLSQAFHPPLIVLHLIVIWTFFPFL